MNKNTKLLVLVLSLALTIGAVMGIAAQAAEGDPVIISQNVEYGGNYALMYAVSADSVKGDTVTLSVYANAECAGDALWTKTVEATEANLETVKGTKCYVFTTAGIAAKDMDVQYYVKVTSANGETVKRYSVAEYFYERLYKNGVAFETTEQAQAQTKLYTSALTYGANAQDVLCNYDSNPDNDRDTFVTDTKYVYVSDGAGTVDGTYASGIFVKGASVTLAIDKAIESWDLYDATTGAKIKSINAGESFAADTHVKAVAVATYRGTGKYANTADTINYTNATMDSLTASKDITTSTKRPLGTTKKVTFSDGALVFTSTGSSWGSIDFYGHNLDNTFVLDTDFFIDGATIDENRASYFVGQSSSQIGTDDGKVYGFALQIYSNPDTTVGGYMLEIRNSDLPVAIPAGKWVNVRLEAYGTAAGSAMKLFINGELAAETTVSESIASLAGLQFCHCSTSGGNGFSAGVMKLDNTYFGSIPFAGERGTGDYAEYALNYTGKTFDDLKADGTITAVKTGATITMKTPESDSALKVDYKANSTWGRYSFKNATEVTDSYVFETDICFNNISIPAGRGFAFYGTSNLSSDAGLSFFGFALVKLDDGSYGVRLNSSKNTPYTINQGEWYNIRVEADAISKSTLRLYVNGVMVDTYNFSDSLSGIKGVQLMCWSTYSGTEGFTGEVYVDNTYVGAKK